MLLKEVREIGKPECALAAPFIFPPPLLADLNLVFLQQESVSELRATNQAAQCLGNRVEMAITKSIENNKTLLKVGLQFEFNDCRNRVAVHLQKNLDRIREDVFSLFFFAYFSGKISQKIPPPALPTFPTLAEGSLRTFLCIQLVSTEVPSSFFANEKFIP